MTDHDCCGGTMMMLILAGISATGGDPRDPAGWLMFVVMVPWLYGLLGRPSTWKETR